MNGDNTYGPGPYQGALIDTLRDAPTLSQPTQGQARPGTTRQRAYEEAEKVRRLIEQQPDVSELERMGRARYEAAGEDIAPAILLQALGGKLAPMGGQILQRSLAARGPQKVTGGELVGGKFVEDPYTAQQRKIQGGQFLTRTLESSAQHEETQADKEAARIAQGQRHAEVIGEQRARRDDARAARSAGGTKQEPLVPVYDPETQQTTYVPRSQAAGGQVPPRGKAGFAGVKLPAEAARMKIGVMSLSKTLDEYDEVLKTFGPRTFAQLDPTERAKIGSLIGRARLEAKEMFQLGALTGPDVEVLNQILADPTSWRGAMYGTGGLSEQLGSARRAVQIRSDAINQQYGDATGTPGPQKPDVSRETRKTIGGKSYVKRDGKWFEESRGD